MAVSSSKKPLSLLSLAAFITIHLMLFDRVHSADSISFSFPRFNLNQQDLILQGDAAVESQSNHLQLTSVDSGGNPLGGSIGRVLYSAPVHLYDSSALVSSFETTFTFTISAPASQTPADGLAFFLAAPDTTIPPGSGGRLLGLFSNPNANNNTRKELVSVKHTQADDRVVAVEFDTYPNTDIGDPDYMHIGIDINSIRSSALARWNWQNGDLATAHISYNSAARRLNVVASYPNASPVTVSYDVDLSSVLPEWIRVGFSATTGLYSQTNTLQSWSFRSELRRNLVEEDKGYIASVV